MKHRFEILSRLASASVALIGLLVVIGWIFDVPIFKSVLPGLASMALNTALAFILAGVALALAGTEPTRRWRAVLLHGCGGLILVLGVLVLGEYGFGWKVGIDQLLHPQTAWPIPNSPPGRRAPMTAFNFTLLGLALLVFNRRRLAWLGQWLAGSVGVLGLLGVLGYAYDVQALYQVASYVPMALHTAVGFCLLALAYLSARPNLGLMAIVASDTYTGAMARRLLPAVILVPAVMGWLRLLGQTYGYYPETFGTALFALGMIVLFTTAVLASLRKLYSLEATRQQAEEKLRQSEERQQATFDNAASFIIEMDAEDRLVAVNDRLCQMLGYRHEELLGMGVHDLTHPEDRPRSDDLHAQLRQGRVPMFQHEGRYLKRDGSPLWVQVAVSAVRDEAGRYRYSVGTVVDISARKAAEAQVRLQAAALEAAPNAVSLSKTDDEGTIVWVNSAFTKMTGYRAEEVIGQSHHLLSSGRQDEAFYRVLWETLRRGEVWRGEMVNRRKDGTFYHEEMGITPLRDEAGKITHYVAIKQDITARKQAEAALRNNEAQTRARAEELSAFMEAVPAFTFLAHDRECRRISGSRATRQLLRVPEEANLSKSAPEGEAPAHVRFLKDGRELAPEELPMQRAAASGREVRDFEMTIAVNDCEWCEIFGNAVPLFDEAGQVRGAVGAFVGITERKRAEAALQRQNQRLQILHQAAADLLVGRDPPALLSGLHERITRDFGGDTFMLYVANGDSEHLRLRACGGVSPEEERRLAQLRFGRAVCVDRKVALQPIVATHLQTVEAPGRRFVRKLGYQAYLYYPLMLGERLLGTLAFASRQREDFEAADQEFFQTIARTLAEALERGRLETEVRRHATQLEQLVRERTAKLQEMVHELEHFSYTITHDMRAPLRAMRMFGQFLLEQNARHLDSTGRDYLQRITASAERMDSLITDALQYSRAVRQELHLEPVESAVLLKGMIQSYPNFQAPKADISIEGELPPVLGTEAGLTQCFSNLLNNAVKFVAPGSRPQVRIWAERRDGFVRLWFADNGIGIPKESQARIFSMFERLNAEYEGTGIGLALVRKIMERMGGRVGVESEPGKGSRFWLDLQAVSAAAPAEPFAKQTPDSVINYGEADKL